MNKYKRKWPCGICGGQVIADFDSGQMYCENPKNAAKCQTIPIPQWVIIDSYDRKKYLENFVPLNKEGGE